MYHTIGVLLSNGGSIIDLDGTLFVQFGLFFLAFLILYLLIFRPMVRLFEARENATEGAREDAKLYEKEALQAGEDYEKELLLVRKTSSQERERLRAEGHELEKRLMEKVRDNTQEQLASAEKRLREEAVVLREEMKKVVPTLASQIATKLLDREVH